MVASFDAIDNQNRLSGMNFDLATDESRKLCSIERYPGDYTPSGTNLTNIWHLTLGFFVKVINNTICCKMEQKKPRTRARSPSPAAEESGDNPEESYEVD
ncbi:hypothetical protein HID58_042849 [Brassica napus]|uniref:Uncharacterized protein n=1 Tax=Brassica napus TaxID=3708 RepID=A0ABQ8BEV7_BRANA|nr:hypothetical protein HID58_042849 [Brassica napus]